MAAAVCTAFSLAHSSSELTSDKLQAVNNAEILMCVKNNQENSSLVERSLRMHQTYMNFTRV